MTHFEQTDDQNIQLRILVDGAMKITFVAFCFLLFFVEEVSAQDKLLPNEVVARSIEPGKTDSYTVALNDGDYVSASINQHGKVNVTILNPDGSLMRRFPGPSSDAKTQIVFAAGGAGRYSINIANPGEQSSKYELLLEKVWPLNERLQQTSWTDPYPSPRIEALRQQVTQKQVSTETFWKQVAKEGTPLVEPFAGDGNYQLVTFLWRSTYDTRHVLVRGSFQVPGLTSLDFVMHRLTDTDVWYLTLKLSKGSRFSYRLLPNVRRATGQADPLNPQRWNCNQDDSKFDCSSMAELPGAAPQPWMIKKAGTPQGKIEQQQIRSEIQILDRSISIYTPPGYKPNGPPNRLLVLFDAEEYLDAQFAMPITMNNLIAASRIPPTVAVLVHNVTGQRLQDLVGNPAFADFMGKELIPWVRARYNVTHDSTQTVVGGFSAGGLAACYTALRYPNIFGNVLSQSGAVYWSPEQGIEDRNPIHETNWTARQFITSPKLAVKFYIEAGVFEADRNGRGGDILEASRQLRDVLLAKGYEVHYHQFVGGHDGLSWRGTLADGLIALLGR